MYIRLPTSGFAVAITTLIWLYLNWLLLLIGAQLAFYHQNPAFLRIGRREPRLSNTMRERLALNTMLLVGRAFRKGDTTISVRDLARELRIPSITLTPIIAGLENDGLLTSTEQEDLLPGREMSRILLNDVIAVVHDKPDIAGHSPDGHGPRASVDRRGIETGRNFDLIGPGLLHDNVVGQSIARDE